MCGSAMCTWKLLTFMDWFYVSLKISSKSEYWSTMCAFNLLTFMGWFYVSLKVPFLSVCESTMCTLKLLTIMNWLNVWLKVWFIFCFVFTLKTLLTFEYHGQLTDGWWFRFRMTEMTQGDNFYFLLNIYLKEIWHLSYSCHAWQSTPLHCV